MIFISKKAGFLFVVGIVICTGLVPTAHALTPEEQAQQAQQVQTIQAQIAALQSQIANLQGTGSQTTSGEFTFTHAMARGSTDAKTGGEVSRLQQVLALDPAIYPEGQITGYFGALTEKALQRWQKMMNIISSGTPATTGYGAVGPKTRAALNDPSNQKPSATPIISKVIPASGSVGSQVVLQGSGFAASNNTVNFGNGIISNLSSTDGVTLIFAIPAAITVPCPAISPSCQVQSQQVTLGSRTISIKSNNKTSNAVSFTVTPRTDLLKIFSSGDITLPRPMVGTISAVNTVTTSFDGNAYAQVTFRQTGFPAGAGGSALSGCTLPCVRNSTITISTSTPEGIYPISVGATAGGYQATTTFNLSVTSPVQSFFKLENATDIIIPRPVSGSATATNSIRAVLNGTAGIPIEFTQSGLPTNTTAAAIPGCNPTCDRTNTITIQSNTPEGTYPITITATGGGMATTTRYNLIVGPVEKLSFDLSNSGNIEIAKPFSGTASATNTIFATLRTGVPQFVTLSQTGFPASTTPGYMPGCQPTCSQINTMTIKFDVWEGVYPITVSANTGTGISTTIYNLIVTPYVPLAFSLENSGDVVITRPSSGTASGSNIITATYAAGRTTQLVFTTQGLPAGAGFTMPACTPTCVKTNTLTINSATPLGTYPVTLTAKGENTTVTTSFDLVVQ